MPQPNDWRTRIICDASIHHGEPTIRGTRIAVSVLVASLTDLSIEENIRVGAQALGHADPAARAEELYGLFPVLREKRRAPASRLACTSGRKQSKFIERPRPGSRSKDGSLEMQAR